MVREERVSVAARPQEYGFTFTFLIYPSDSAPGKYVAHCLELDLVAVESNRPRAIELGKELIEDLIEAAVADDTLEKIFKPAPAAYWAALAHSTPYDPPEEVRRRRIRAPRVRRVDYAEIRKGYVPGTLAPTG